jgi:hypothetical protein
MPKKNPQNPNPIIEVLETILALKEEHVSVIGEYISNYNSSSSYKNLPDAIKEHFDLLEATNLFTFLKYAQNSLQDDFSNADELKIELVDFFKSHSIEKSEDWSAKLNNRLWKIFDNNKKIETFEWHQSGVVDKLLDFDSFVDIRPVFIDNKISNLIPIVIFRVAIHKDYENPKSFVFQATKEEFEDLENKIKDAKERLAKITDKLSNDVVTNLFIEENV